MSRWKLKKLGTFALSVSMAFLIAIPVKAVEVPAEDIQGHWAQIPMEWAKEEGIITGTSAMTLSPDLITSRAMAVTVLYRYQGSPEVKPTRSFSDVSQNAYYANAVEWAVQEGIVNGRSETSFAPNDPVTRQEFVTMLYRWHVAEKGVPLEIGKDNVYTVADFDDTQNIRAYAADAMAWAVGDLFLLGTTQGDVRLLNPPAPITRGELAKILYQYDCAVLGNPGKPFAYRPEDVEKIQVRSGKGPNYFIMDSNEIARFLEKVNGFTYTKQRSDLLSGGWYYAFELYTKEGRMGPERVTLLPNGVRVSVDSKGEIFYTNEEQPDYFTEDWVASFDLKE